MSSSHPHPEYGFHVQASLGGKGAATTFIGIPLSAPRQVHLGRTQRPLPAVRVAASALNSSKKSLGSPTGGFGAFGVGGAERSLWPPGRPVVNEITTVAW